MSAQPQEQPAINYQARHRRETWLQVYLWLGFGIGLLVLAFIIAAALPQPIQVEILANFLVTVLVLCPLAICLFPLYIIAVLLVVGMGKVNDQATTWLTAVEKLSDNLYQRVDKGGERIARSVINFSIRIAPAEKLIFGAFDPPAKAQQKGQETAHDPDDQQQ